jgi:hypothetical protein
MTSLSSVIVRTPARPNPARRMHSAARPHPVRALAVENLPEVEDEAFENLKLFATGWVAGLVFFGTFLA